MHSFACSNSEEIGKCDCPGLSCQLSFAAPVLVLLSFMGLGSAIGAQMLFATLRTTPGATPTLPQIIIFLQTLGA